MKISLSALLPVFNNQATVGSLVSPLLDVLAEFTHRFEIVVIDNGSTDATAEVLAELALPYPQINRVVLPRRSDWASVVRAGLKHSTGEIVLHRSERCQSGTAGLSELWQAMRLGDVAVIRPRETAALGSIPPLPPEGGAIEPDWQMVRRCALDGWMRTKSSRDWVSFLAARGFAVQEIDPRTLGPRFAPRPNGGLRLPVALEYARATAAAAQARSAQPAATPAPSPGAPSHTRPTRRPNYLDRIKAFALGE
ncbi:MAG TPA: glycosyltransferase [Pirellulales bacterium]|nr:glycosyltransferase [Pirellulales bacterium]